MLTDEVSTTALVAGLHTVARASWLDDRSNAAWESHLTLRDLRRLDLDVPAAGVVYVCENPRILEAAVDTGSRHAIVCTMGQPAVVVTAVLDRLGTAGAELRYHGDFDWSDIAIANALVGTHGCRPWRFGARDYVDALASLAPTVAELPPLGSAPTQPAGTPSSPRRWRGPGESCTRSSCSTTCWPTWPTSAAPAEAVATARPTPATAARPCAAGESCQRRHKRQTIRPRCEGRAPVGFP